MKGLIFGFVLLAAVLPVSADVPNGVFGDPGGTFTTLGTGYSPTLGWTVTSGSVDWIGNYWSWTAPPNGHAIDLDGNAPGTIQSQDITGLTPGQFYTLSFWLSGNPDGGSLKRTVQVSVAGASQGFSYTLSNTGPGHLPLPLWEPETLIFKADAGPDQVTFASTDPVGSAYGPVLADVQVNVYVPEPSFYLNLALGLAAAFAFAWRKRQV